MPESDEWRRSTEEKLHEIRKDLYIGNGRPGLTYRMQSVENDVMGIKEREDRRSKKQDRIELAVWAAVIMGILQLIFSHIH